MKESQGLQPKSSGESAVGVPLSIPLWCVGTYDEKAGVCGTCSIPASFYGVSNAGGMDDITIV
jgi:hypothetical protein